MLVGAKAVAGPELGSARARRDAALLPLLAALPGLSALAAPGEAGAAGGAVAVLGAGGRTGRLCVEALRSAGQPFKALSRAEADVAGASVEELAAAVRGSAAVIFAASASSKGGNAQQVDEQGAVKAAKACLLAGVPKFVLISSGGARRAHKTHPRRSGRSRRTRRRKRNGDR